MQLLEIIWWGSWIILLGYHLVIFRGRQKTSADDVSTDFPGVSMVIAVKNGSDRLLQNMGFLLSQDYPLFEIIVIDDYSDTGEKNKLEDFAGRNPGISFVLNTGLPGKKQALTLGIQNARFDWILCTDADCRPAGKDWIKQMMIHSKGADVVLGYSPYSPKNGLLNCLVRFETVMTAIQYLSWALRGRPYMGVGRNILYPRSLFLKTDPYKNHASIPYGDDDLWVQHAAEITPVEVCLDPAAYVYSDPPTTWSGWLNQKHRHMSAAHHYSFGKWWQPGLFGTALILHWVLLAVLAFDVLDFKIIVCWMAGLFVRWYVYNVWTKRLGDRDTTLWYPVLEVIYAAYLAGMGIITFLVKKKTWN